jgi:hypothetical protein
MGKPDPPQPPNPVDTARASTSTNVATSIANAFLNNTNQITPTGNLSFDQTGSYDWNDPYTGLNVNIPTFTATQTPTEQERQILNQTEATKYNLAGMANYQSGRLSDFLSTDLNATGGAPAAGDPRQIGPYQVDQTFDADWYAKQNPDVIAAGMDPLTHWKMYGQQEGRAPNDGSKTYGVKQAATSFAPAGQQQMRLGPTGQQQTGFADVGGPQSSIGDFGGPQSSFGYTPGQIFGFGGAGDITKSYGPGDFSADRNKVEDSLMARMNPQLAVEKQKLEQQLADQGIRYGSAAYTNAMDNYNRQANDARFAAVNQAGTEQQRMMDMAAQRAGFENAAQQQQFQQAQSRGQFYNTAEQTQFGEEQARGSFANAAQQQRYAQLLGAGTFANQAQQQAYEQAMGRGTFANTAQQQQFQEELQSGTFANQAQQNEFQQAAARGEFENAGLAQQVAQAQSTFNAQNMSRNQYMNEQYAMRNQPINEITSLLSGSQISNPNFVNTPNNQIPTTDVAGLINTRFSQDMDIYKQESQQQQALMGGIFGMLGGMMKMSDERMKENVVRIGSVFATDIDHDEPNRSADLDRDEAPKKELPIYSYSYKHDPASTRHIGPMAQDVEKIDKRAVKTRGGIKYIEPARVMGNVFSTAA